MNSLIFRIGNTVINYDISYVRQAPSIVFSLNSVKQKSKGKRAAHGFQRPSGNEDNLLIRYLFSRHTREIIRS